MLIILSKQITIGPGDTGIFSRRTTLRVPAQTAENVVAHRILNSGDPVRIWRTSPRPSKITFAYQRHLKPESQEEAAALLKSLNGAGIIWAQEPLSDPFPFGIIWVNFEFTAGRKAFRAEQWKRECQERHQEHAWKGYVGNTMYQDGSKFHSLSGYIVILEKAWSKKLAANLGALLEIQKGEPRG